MGRKKPAPKRRLLTQHESQTSSTSILSVQLQDKQFKKQKKQKKNKILIPIRYDILQSSSSSLSSSSSSSSNASFPTFSLRNLVISPPQDSFLLPIEPILYVCNSSLLNNNNILIYDDETWFIFKFNIHINKVEIYNIEQYNNNNNDHHQQQQQEQPLGYGLFDMSTVIQHPLFTKSAINSPHSILLNSLNYLQNHNFLIIRGKLTSSTTTTTTNHIMMSNNNNNNHDSSDDNNDNKLLIKLQIIILPICFKNEPLIPEDIREHRYQSMLRIIFVYLFPEATILHSSTITNFFTAIKGYQYPKQWKQSNPNPNTASKYYLDEYVDYKSLPQHPDLLPTLRQYQLRASDWMFSRETRSNSPYKILLFNKNIYSLSRPIPNPNPTDIPLNISDSSCILSHPLYEICKARCPKTNVLKTFYFNRYSGSLSYKSFPNFNLNGGFGGILADEMGLGKTLECIQLILSHSWQQQNIFDRNNNNTRNLSLTTPSDWSIQMNANPGDVWCICGNQNDQDYNGLWVECELCYMWSHAVCVGFHHQYHSSNEQKEEHREVEQQEHKHQERFICPMCWNASPTLYCKTTLIVSPDSIASQWEEEIARHVKKNALSLYRYNGLRNVCSSDKRQKWISPFELSKYDIVITTYSVLRKELPHIAQYSQRSLRFNKKYLIVPSPLISLHFWRLVMDEAQLIENASKAAEMVGQLEAENRWAVTGTPIPRSFDDLYWLLRFIRISPFNIRKWWRRCLGAHLDKTQIGQIVMARRSLLFAPFMWRSSRSDACVLKELNVPRQHVLIHNVYFSQIEEYYYNQIYERTKTKMIILLNKFRSQYSCGTTNNVNEIVLRSSEISTLLNILYMLRRVCSRPQIIGISSISKKRKYTNIFSTISSYPRPLKVLLSTMIEQANHKCSEELRAMIAGLNGSAGIALISNNSLQAIEFYREVLAFDAKYSTISNKEHINSNNNNNNNDNNNNITRFFNFSVDSLQIIHALTNLSQVLDTLTEDQRSKNSDLSSSSQRQLVSLLRKKYLFTSTSKCESAHIFLQELKQEVDKMRDVIKEIEPWWGDCLNLLFSSNLGKQILYQKLNEFLGSSINPFSAMLLQNLQSKESIAYMITSETNSLFSSRNEILLSLFALQHIPTQAEIDISGSCSQCRIFQKGSVCSHCKLKFKLKQYEQFLGIQNIQNEDSKVFENEDDEEENTNESKDQLLSSTRNKSMSNSKSNLELLFHILYVSIRSLKSSHHDLIAAASTHLQIFPLLRREMIAINSLWSSQYDLLSSYDELSMCTTRIRTARDGEVISQGESMFVLPSYSIPSHKLRIEQDLAHARASFAASEGQLRYLSHLQTQEELKESVQTQVLTTNIVTEERELCCPICLHYIHTSSSSLQQQEDHKIFGRSMLPCGHSLCLQCALSLIEKTNSSSSSSSSIRIKCPLCRLSAFPSQLVHVANQNTKQQHEIDNQNHDHTKTKPLVKGFSAKIDAIILLILKILNSKEPQLGLEESHQEEEKQSSKEPQLGLEESYHQKEEGQSKILVFSQWLDILNEMRLALIANDIPFLSFKSTKLLAINLKTFKTSESIHIFLLPVSVGGQGLNIVEANHCILIEPMLDNASQAQAAARIHRIGQTKSTFVHRFVVNNTIEAKIDKICQMQSIDTQNDDLDSLAVQPGEAQARLTIQDFMSLFD